MRLHSLEAERLSPGRRIPPWVRNEHVKRYEFAASFVRDKIVVDCACGDGEGTRGFLNAGASRIHAFDVSEGSVVATRAKCDAAAVEVLVADGLALPMEAESADVFISLETIEHIDHDAAFVGEIVRVLRPGGLLVCSTPNRTVTNPGLERGGRPFNPFHVQEYSSREFRELLAGRFAHIALYGQNPSSTRYTGALSAVGRMTPFRGATRLVQFVKLPRFVRYDAARAEVVQAQYAQEYEYLVAVCRKATDA